MRYRRTEKTWFLYPVEFFRECMIPLFTITIVRSVVVRTVSLMGEVIAIHVVSTIDTDNA